MIATSIAILSVNEIFGPTLQGEGKNLGMPCFFLRLSGCNLSCVFCDTPYTWDWTGKNGKAFDITQERHLMTVNEVVEKLEVLEQMRGGNVFNLVISGGEPMLQQRNLIPLVDELREEAWWVEIETAGTIPPLRNLSVDQFTVSLKLNNSGNLQKKRYIPEAVQGFVDSEKAVFKFVVSNLSDFDEIEKLVNAHLICNKCIYIMPEGVTQEDVQKHAQLVAQETIQRGWNLTTRLQILLYGNQRGI